MFRSAGIALLLLATNYVVAQEFLGRPERPTKPPPMESTTPKPKNASYWVTYSKSLRPGHPLDFQIEILKGQEPVDVVIVVKNTKGEQVLTGRDSISPGNPKIITLDVPLDFKKPDPENRWNRNFDVMVTGKGIDMSFKDNGYVQLLEKAFSIFVQTDKAMYKPSQTVNFRTLAMTPDMMVMKGVKQDIVVTDAKGNRILQYKEVEALESMGVVQKSFNLASSVPIGLWKIEVSIEGVTEYKEFEVADYVLPRFEVEILGSIYGVRDDVLYTFTVKAMYTFGKPVTNGFVDIEIDKPHWRWYNKPPSPIIRRGKLNSDGEMKVELTIAELLRLEHSYNPGYKTPYLNYQQFEITANVTERQTDRVQSGSHTFQFHDSLIKMEYVGITPKTFKSGLDFTAYIEVTKQDKQLFTRAESKLINVLINVTYDAPMIRSTTTEPPTTEAPTTTSNNGKDLPEIIPRRIIGNVGHNYNQESFTLALDKNIYSVPDNGWIVVTFRVPEEATSLSIKATTKSPFRQTTAFRYASKSISPSNTFMQLNAVTKNPKVGDIMTVVAKSTGQMKKLHYQVSSKQLLQYSSSEKGPSNSLVFTFEITRGMAPSMSILAFFFTEDGEVVADQISLSIEGIFDNSVSAEFSKEKVRPGEDVNLIVEGKPDSIVFLLAVDKSVKLLKSGNDITQDLLRQELASYDGGNYNHWRYMFVCGWPSYSSGTDASSVFEGANVNVMTDGTVYNRYEYGSDRIYPAVEGSVPETDMSDNDQVAKSKGPDSESGRTRKSFPENWLWDIKTIPPNSGGKVVIPLTAPDTITTWIASVFSANPSTGLSVAKSPANVTTFIDMFISLDLPSSIIRYEEFCFPASVFSYYSEEISVMLTLEGSEDYRAIWIKKEKKSTIAQRESISYSHFLGIMKEGEVLSATFCFTPDTIGLIPIKVSAKTNVDGLSDRVVRMLHVKPEGFPRSTTVPFLVEPNKGSWTQVVPIQFPTDKVNDSERISVSVAGNLLGSIFDNMEDLLKKPYGCGEQNMINFAPIMSLLDFFFTTNTITDKIREKGVEYMFMGYQKEILYEHNTTGGYSTFGNNKNTMENPSMWLTAFVTKCFSQAEYLDMSHKNLLAIDINLIRRSALWMLRQQAKNGSFVEHGRVFNKGLQGGSAKGIALTAYTVIALHHVLKASKSFDNRTTSMVFQILRNVFISSDKMLCHAGGEELDLRDVTNGMGRGIAYLENNIAQLDDSYDVCITAYALNLVDSQTSGAIFELLKSKAVTGSGMTYWERPKKNTQHTYHWWSRHSEAIDIEMTAYALLTYSLRGVEGLSIVRWLGKQKGEHGGFISTQDTVIGIEALTTVAKKLHGAEFVPMTLEITSLDKNGAPMTTAEFQITKANEMTLQRKDIAFKGEEKILLSAVTGGLTDTSVSTALVDVVFNYNVKSETEQSYYDMSHAIEMHKDGFLFEVRIWTVDGTNASMTILEVELPAGFQPDSNAIATRNMNISMVESNDVSLIVYIDTDVIDGKGIKLILPIENTSGKLVTPKAKNYRVYNYYEPEMELSRNYYLTGNGSPDYCVEVPQLRICEFP